MKVRTGIRARQLRARPSQTSKPDTSSTPMITRDKADISGDGTRRDPFFKNLERLESLRNRSTTVKGFKPALSAAKNKTSSGGKDSHQSAQELVYKNIGEGALKMGVAEYSLGENGRLGGRLSAVDVDLKLTESSRLQATGPALEAGAQATSDENGNESYGIEAGATAGGVAFSQRVGSERNGLTLTGGAGGGAGFSFGLNRVINDDKTITTTVSADAAFLGKAGLSLSITPGKNKGIPNGPTGRNKPRPRWLNKRKSD